MLWIWITIIIITVSVIAVQFFRYNNSLKRLSATMAKIENEKKNALENNKVHQADLSNISDEKRKFEEEKKKFEEKNRKLWQMNEAVYKEKKKVDEENEKLLQAKEKLENEKKKFEEKNKKLWNQSIAIHKEKERIDILRKEIEEKHHNVTESIRYAQRIQRAILPPAEVMKQLLPDSFVLYRPKDIVSGDFYWVESTANHEASTEHTFAYIEPARSEQGRTVEMEQSRTIRSGENPSGENIVLFSVIDCTGHGVPGAFMSIFGHSLFNQATDEHRLVRPSDIMNFINSGVMKQLRVQTEGDVVKDGMDLVVCALHKEKMLLEFSGVHNPLYLVRGDELIQYKTDKQAIGEPYEDGFTGYTNITVPLEKGDIIYIFSDGFCDQFGGQQKRKFMSKNFRETLLGMRTLTMENQRAKLELILDDWRGSIEQYDDITVMGVKM